MWPPCLILLLGLATVSSTVTYWTKIDQPLKLNCTMPAEGEKLHVCSWRNGSEGAFKSSFKESHGDRISIKKTDANCTIRIESVEEEDIGTWGCQLLYQNKEGESVKAENDVFVVVANSSAKISQDFKCTMPDEGDKLQFCSWRNGDEGVFKLSFKKSHGDRISVIDPKENDNECLLRIESVEEEDIGTWECQIRYQNSVGESVDIVYLARKSVPKENLTDCNPRIEGVEEEDEGIGGCQIRYPNSEEESGMAANFSAQNPTLKELIDDENKTETIYQNSIWESVEENGWVANVSNFWVEHPKERIVYDKMMKTKPFFNFAYSVALSLSAGAAGSTTAEIGVGVGANSEVLIYAAGCVGLKADVSLELDLSVGFWKSIDDILGLYYMLGVGTDITGNKTDETEANVKIIKNYDGKLIGGTFSLGVGEGPDLPIAWEVNFDHCYALEIWRIGFSDLYEIVMEKIRSKLTKKFLKIITKIATLTHESFDI